MSEANLWKRMREGIKPFAFAQRLENIVGLGVPDVVLHSRVNGACAFVELKHRPELPVRDSTPVFAGQYGLRPEQVAWIYGRAEVGARVWILAHGGDSMWLVHGRLARGLETFSVIMLDESCTIKEPARKTNWPKIIGKTFYE